MKGAMLAAAIAAIMWIFIAGSIAVIVFSAF